jgi:hypothetical protein
MPRLNPFPWRVRDRILLPAMIAVYVVLMVVLPALTRGGCCPMALQDALVLPTSPVLL